MSKTPRQPPPQAAGLTYAIGDIHGRADLLITLIERIMADSADANSPPEVVFLGDYVDRGPESRQTLELLLAIADWPEIKPVFLLGNHELMLLRFLADPARGRHWLRFGGYETLVSYGIRSLGDLDDLNTLREIAGNLRDAMSGHVDFVEDLRASHLSGNLFFTHAGADPELAPEEQPIEALAWGTPAFEDIPRNDGLWVVHGHTIVERPLVKDGRISLDTGAYRTGRLTALKAEGDQLSFLTQTGPAGAADDY